jgi:hypothetical protein
VTAAISALRHDAQVWDEVTRLAGQEAGALSLGESQLSWASVASGLRTNSLRRYGRPSYPGDDARSPRDDAMS